MGSLETTFIMNSLLCVLVIFSATSVCCEDSVEREGVEIFTSRDLIFYNTYDDDSDEEIEKDFEYFYNLEMMKALDRLENKTEAHDEDAYDEYGVEANYYEDSTELDLLLDDLLNEEDLIEESLDDFDYELPITLPKSDVTRKEIREKSRNRLNLILLISSLLASISILLISLAWTANHCYRKVDTEEENVVKAEEPPENILLRAGSKILWKGRSNRHVSKHEQWI